MLTVSHPIITRESNSFTLTFVSIFFVPFYPLMKVYTLRYSDCFGSEYVSVFDTLDAVLKRLEITALHPDSFDEDESYHIECKEIVTLEEQTLRTNRVIEHHKS